jgi:dTDP-4-dehydrorhamnose 3,5-epimerase-like enzyme
MNEDIYPEISILGARLSGLSLYIPEGFAHGFLTQGESNIVLCLVDKRYSPQHEGGIRYDSFGFHWQICTHKTLSKRDLSFIKFSNFRTPFGGNINER